MTDWIGKLVVINNNPSTRQLDDQIGKSGVIIDVLVLKNRVSSWMIRINGNDYIADSVSDFQIKQ